METKKKSQCEEKIKLEDKFSKIKLQPGVDFIEFKIYYDSLKKAYKNTVNKYLSDGFNNLVATNLAYSDLLKDIEAVKEGRIAFYSAVPGFRRY